ncbi:hypothetical protein KR067_004680, partial [Drosophila pandora]
NKRCMGEILLLIRFMAEKYETSQNVRDQEKDKISDVLKKCKFKMYEKISAKNILYSGKKLMKQLYMIFPWHHDEVELNQHEQYTYQFLLNSVIFELEKIAETLLKDCQSSKSEKQNPFCNTENIDELADLRIKLKNAETKRQLQDLSHKLLLLKETTLASNAIAAQQKAEEELAKEKDHNADLRNRLAITKRNLELANDENRERKEAFITLQRSYMALQRDQSCRKESDPEEIQEKQVKIATKDSNKTLKTSPSAMKVIRKELEPKTLSVLKQQLSYARISLVEAKTTVSEIKRDISNLCYKDTMILNRTKKNKAKKTLITLKHTRQDTLRVIDGVLKAFQFHKQLKFPACEIRWRVVCRSLQENLLKVRENWRYLDLENLKKSSIKAATDLNLSSAISPRSNPAKLPFDYPEMWWDKIYSPTKTASETTILFSRTEDLKVDPSVTSKVSSRTVVSNASSLRAFQGKTFGDRRLLVLKWCQEKTRPYGVPMYEFSNSWTSGRALCALIHAYRPQLIAPKYLRRTGPVETIKFGVSVAQGLGVCSPIDLVQECSREKPNYERVFEFVQELQRCLE